MLYKFWKFIHHMYLNTTDRQPCQCRINIKKSGNHKSSLLKLYIICQRLSHITGTDYNNVVLSIETKDFSNLLIQILHIITVSLLTKTTKIIQILTDLRSSYFHSHTQLIG